MTSVVPRVHSRLTTFVVGLLVFLPFFQLHSQDLRASLTGLVADSTGAVIPNATVTATNIDTQVASTTQTNAAGSYVLLFLIPGQYRVQVEADGFKKLVRESVVLSTSERGTLDIALEVGQVTETISVSDAAPLLETATASRINAVTGQQVTDLPSQGRSIFNQLLALPGVQKQDRRWGAFSNYGLVNSTRISINGGIARDNEALMDGVVNTQPDRSVTFQPPLEAVSEVSAQTSNFDASYGRLGGGVTAVTTKNGTNALHGSAFAYHTNSAFAANSWQQNFIGQPKPSAKMNQFGFEVDGPVFIPKFLDGRNKLFFMFSYEARRVNDAGGETTVLPDSALRGGDFASVSRVIYDPLTTTPAGVRTPFAGNRIPTSRINAVSSNLVSLLPLPNISGQAYGLPNYISSVGSTGSYNQFYGRIDYRINDKNSVYVTGGHMPYAETDGVLYADSPADPSTENPLGRYFDRYVADWTHTLDALTVFNLRAGYVRYGERSGNPHAVGFDQRSLGIDPALISQQRVAMFPRVEIGGFYTTIGSPNPLNRAVRDTQSYQANLHRAQGRHQIKVGTEFRIYNANQWTSGYSGGRYLFDRGFTQANPIVSDAASGEEFASFLLGYPVGGQMDLAIDPSYQSRYYTTFVQDDIRLSNRLTVNLGFRWDYETPTRERYNRMVRGFAFDEASPLASAVPGLKGGLLYAGNDGNSRFAFNPDRNNFQPRIGAAWQVNKNLVLRGGYGLYYMATFGGQASTGFSATTPLVSSADAGLTPRVNMTNAFPGQLIQPIGSSQGLATNLGQSVDFSYLERGTPYSHQYSFGFQQLLPWGMVAEATYSANLSRRYPVDLNLNAIPKNELGNPNSYYTERVTNPFRGLLPLNSAKNGATIPRQDLLMPFPQFTSVTMRNIPLGKNDYHGLQTRLAMRYRNGMTLNFGYVWSKTLEERSFLNPQDFNLQDIDSSKLERRLAEFDAPHRFTAMWTYMLPFGKGHRLGSNVNGLVDKIISGWQVNATGILQSGFVANFPNAMNLEARSAKLSGDQRDLYHLFDTSLFPTAAPNLNYTYRTWPTRFPDVRTNPLRNLDASISKKTRLTEGLTFEFRAEAYNVTNTPWFNVQHSRGADVAARNSGFGWFALSSETNRTMTLIGKFIW